MADKINKQNLREQSKERYRDKKNVEAKWISQYGSIDRENDFRKNQSCIKEVFNMLDFIMENIIDDYIASTIAEEAKPVGRSTRYTFRQEDGSTVTFFYPHNFASRVKVMRKIGYDISDEVYFDTRQLRNETTHGSQTVTLQNMDLDYQRTLKAMLSLADALILTGMLDPELRIPPFEKLRVREGGTLQSGSYRILSQIGEGGMSRVYKAEQVHVGRIVAVKELKPEMYSEEQIRYERDIVLHLHHDLIPHVYDVFSENATYYIVMGYVDGITLEEYVQMNYPIPIDVTDTLSHSILDVLSYLHSSEVGIVFADLSPGNILISQDTKPFLIDFGISSKMSARQYIPAATLGYAAPEILTEDALDQRSDIYSFGYLLRFICTGYSPLEKKDTATSELIQDKRIADVINHCIARNPEERFQTVSALQNALFHLQESQLAEPSQRKKRKWLPGVIFAALIGCGGTAAFFMNNPPFRQEKDSIPDSASAAESSTSQIVIESAISDSAEAISETVESDEALSDSTTIYPELSAMSRRSIDMGVIENSGEIQYDYDHMTLSIMDPVDGWYAGLVDWNGKYDLNLLIAASSAQALSEPLAFYNSPVIREGLISTIKLTYTNGSWVRYDFQLNSDGQLVSYNATSYSQVSTTTYTYAGNQLAAVETDFGGSYTLGSYEFTYSNSGILSSFDYLGKGMLTPVSYTVTTDINDRIISVKSLSTVGITQIGHSLGNSDKISYNDKGFTRRSELYYSDGLSHDVPAEFIVQEGKLKSCELLKLYGNKTNSVESSITFGYK